ncbi:MBL fold metallo-hydrolase [Roseomonas stagni]|uniref:MBL fold metallo-hydrolase n=1 Tax=Falsiroseomonas algicola TaxID=2716930 RepID=A0A6M1LI90_9PROT|nr:MBL fold metallo-hydrolase [Falsiroseomonas algicola]NGM20026.1 MBL fold metallo-hydrolase [Falsiroseomonas algicola]
MSWTVETLIQGYPGKSKQQGGLGFSTVALARGPEGRIAVLDTSRSGARRLILDRLKEVGVAAEAVTDVLVTHLHYDHVENWPMFRNALIHVPGAEMDYALRQPEGAPLWPEFCLRALADSPRMRRLAEGETGIPGITCFEAPGHSPHHLVFVLEGTTRTIFSADVAKNRAELATGIADMTMDAEVHRASIARLNAVWRDRPGTVLLPGHDVALRIGADGQPEAIEARKLEIQAWFGASLDDVTKFDVTESGAT